MLDYKCRSMILNLKASSLFKDYNINWILTFVALSWNELERRKKPHLDSIWKRSLAE